MTSLEPTYYDLVFKTLLLGDSGVGKSAILKQYVERYFDGEYVSTIGIDYACKYLSVDGKTIKLSIWDTAGQERFHSITKSYMRGIQCVILIYDITSIQSFRDVKNWIKMVSISNVPQAETQPIKYYLIGNKTDLLTKRMVTYEQGTQLAKECGCKFFEVSAKDHQSIQSAFASIAKDLANSALHISMQPMNISIANTPSQKNKCCF